MQSDSTSPRICPHCKEAPVHTNGYCRACRQEYMHAYYQKTREQRLEQQKERYYANIEAETASRTKKRRAVRLEVIEAYGGKCECCGETHIEFLAIHHRNGNGKKHRMEASGVGDGFFRWLRRNGFPEKDALGVLCHNCNMSHGFYGYCPHERERVTVAAGISQLILA